ncbi:fluoride efflux transporter FluC [Allorhodopirellula heiligendammensis]|uniref:Fluoride-specific ion channel FluC n=1 Tax=Allorhodopirellula heiligendammensis TaxID=2714739 RepID=A0A5C6BUS5_9BACT|nr:CrcB family protein [Allorhodopirellula heiligendammensis]TWU15201.1 putative fluoride ion transporter CrcB [Allorhodopirellula heiligendammensis]
MMGWSMNVLAVAIGGSLGALCRYGLTVLFAQGPLQRLIGGISHLVGGEAGFATTLANLLGCLLLGSLYQWTESLADLGETPLSPHMLLAIRVGILGSLTTFSTLVGDITVLSSEGRVAASLTMLSVNLVGGCALFLLAAASVRGLLS